MGCASSKILARSGSYKEEVRQRLKGANGLEELLVSKNDGDRFIALLRTTSTVTKKLKEESPRHQPEDNTSKSLDLTESESTDRKMPDPSANLSDGFMNIEIIETIDARELLAGLEDDNVVEGEEKFQHQMHQSVEGISTAGLPSNEEDKLIVNNELVLSKTVNSNEETVEDDVSGTRSIHTVEDYDAVVANNKKESCIYKGPDVCSVKEYPLNSAPLENTKAGTDIDLKHVNYELESIHITSNETVSVASKSDPSSKKLSKRVSMAKELGVLKIPSLEFSKSGSLRDWLLQGGLVVSPGSPITPKFGEFVSPYAKDTDALFDTSIFDPELVAQFEQAMKQLTMEEENILTQILADLGGSIDEGISRTSKTAEDMQM